MELYVWQGSTGIMDGSKEHPYDTISKAAQAAMPGDTVLVGPGVYREWVSPARGGTDEAHRITYRNAEAERPVISGAELLENWVPAELSEIPGAGSYAEETGPDGADPSDRADAGETQATPQIYRASLPREVFTDINPYETLLGGDWFDPMGRDHRLGEVFADDVALVEAESPEALADPGMQDKGRWLAVPRSDRVDLYVCIPGGDPGAMKMEATVRPAAFFPREEHLDFITVTGFVLEKTASQWAPPTALQMGVIGPHWSWGWVIESCEVRFSKCVGISLGKRKEATDNAWSTGARKEGAQTYTEGVFTNLSRDWRKGQVGGHVIRHCHIHHCGQVGIGGALGGAFSVIEANHIHHCCMHGQFGGAEIAAIKLHAAIDVLIIGNCIHDSWQGVWLDWEAQGARLSRNALWNNYCPDFFPEVSHGPILVDNNLFLSELSVFNVSQGIAYVHNLFRGTFLNRRELGRFTMYHLPHATDVLGSSIIYGGDDRLYNNIFIGCPTARDGVAGPGAYNGYPAHVEEPDFTLASTTICGLPREETPILPMFMADNLCYEGALTYDGPGEEDRPASLEMPEEFKIRISYDDGGWDLDLRMPESVFKNPGKIISTETLGRAFMPDMPYENADGTPITLDKDFVDMERDQAWPGPFAKNVIHIRLVEDE